MHINLQPTTCNVCGGQVEYIKLTSLYGHHLKHHHNGDYCYHCKCCGATVGTHRNQPELALGILADKETASARKKCHDMFDGFWRNSKERTLMYQRLANELGIPFEECHFGWFTLEVLDKAYSILLKWWRDRYDR